MYWTKERHKPSASYNLFSASSTGFTDLSRKGSNRYLQFRPITSNSRDLHLFPTAVGGSRSDDDCTSHQLKSIAEYH